MRALLVTNPGAGHANPMYPLAAALEARGADVRFATSAAFCPSVQAHGFTAEPAGMDWLLADVDRTFPERADLTWGEQSTWFLTDVFADAAARAMVSDLIGICDRWGPDVLIRNDFEFATCVAAEIADVPHATFGISLFMAPATLEPWIGDQLAYLRSIHGLEPFPSMEMLYPHLYLTIAPPGLHPTSSPVMRLVRTAPVTEPGREPPEWIGDLPDRPTVYVSLGTIFNRDPGLLPTVIEALADEPVNLIATVGMNQDPEAFGPHPPNVRIERYVPQELLLPHCDAFVTTGSFATSLASVRHSVPLVVLPITGDDRLMARRVVSLRLGLALDLPGRFDVRLDGDAPILGPAELRRAVREVLNEPAYRLGVERVRREMAASPPLDHAVELLAAVAAGSGTHPAATDR